MKKYKLKLKIFALLVLLLPACDNILDKDPVDRYSDAVVWTDIDLADSYLTTAYRNVYYGYYGALLDDAFSDIDWFIFGRGAEVYNEGNITADNLGIFSYASRTLNINWELFKNIKIINVFLEHIDEIMMSYPTIKQAGIQKKADILKGEALFLRAYSYAQMTRLWGGLPIIKTSFSLGDDYLSVPRATFKETIDAIVEDCDAAAALLKSKTEMESGRATKGAALALKSRMLLFAASDLTADGTAESKYVGYESPDRNALWTAAKNAAKAVIDLNEYELSDFGSPDNNAVAEGYFDFFKQKTLSDNEVIWGKMFVEDVGDRITWNRVNGSNGLNNWGANNPTQSLVDSYQMEDGSDFFDHFYVDGNGFYRNKGTTKYKNPNPYLNREPRFYGTILCDSSIWQKRFENLVGVDPVGIYDRRTRITISGGDEIYKRYGLDTRCGPVEKWNGSYTGYLLKKTMDDEVVGKSEYNTNIWIFFRYAEVLLNYAEACIELDDIPTATTYINMIRNRSGLPDFTGDITVALRHERLVELAFEDLRWYDIRRWKTMTNHNVKGIDIVETTNLDDGTVTTTWQQLDVQMRSMSKKMFWLPIATEELKKAPQLEQNPGY